MSRGPAAADPVPDSVPGLDDSGLGESGPHGSTDALVGADLFQFVAVAGDVVDEEVFDVAGAGGRRGGHALTPSALAIASWVRRSTSARTLSAVTNARLPRRPLTSSP